MITKIKERLIDDIDKIRNILEEIGCLKIKLVKDNFKFANDDEGSFSGNGNSINTHTLSYCSYSHNIRGDIITLVSYKLNLELGDSIRWLAKYLGLSWEYKQRIETTPPFGGFYLNFEKVQEENYNFKTIDGKEVEDYEKNGLSLYWIREGVSAITQEKFHIGYDPWSGRLTIPWRSITGEYLGIIGRLDKVDCEDWETRYLPIIPFYKQNTLYGLYENYKAIQKLGKVVIVESEKACLMAQEMGYTNVISVGSHNLAPYQIKLIKSLAVDVILAYDEDIPLEESIKQAKELQISNPFFTNETYVLDMTELKEKSCIFDLDKTTVDEAFENRLIYIGE